jgi:osmotically-inducible protein OsmY
MQSTRRAASSIAAIALIVTAAACMRGDTDATDTAAGTVGGTAAATQTPVNVREVENRVEVALSTDTALRMFALDADDEDNRIVIKGAVRTEALRTLAAEIAAREAAGIPIDNRIRVVVTAGGSGSQPVDIDEVEERVEDALEAEASLKPFKFNADEEAGQLVVEGTVQTAEQKTLAEQIARRVAGTVTIVSRIRVQ